MKKLQYLVIHCTATRQGEEVSSDQIRAWHTSPPPVGRGWKQVGYTDLFHQNGSVERLVENNDDEFVDSWEITNGATGINSISRHIVYAGGLDSHLIPMDTRTAEQKEALRKYILLFVQMFPNVRVCGHYQFAPKACPCFDVPLWLRSIGVPNKNIFTR